MRNTIKLSSAVLCLRDYFYCQTLSTRLIRHSRNRLILQTLFLSSIMFKLLSFALAANQLAAGLSLPKRQDNSSTSIHDLFVANGRTYIGTCADQGTLSNQANVDIITSSFGQLTAENSMKWDATERMSSALFIRTHPQYHQDELLLTCSCAQPTRENSVTRVLTIWYAQERENCKELNLDSNLSSCRLTSPLPMANSFVVIHCVCYKSIPWSLI